MWYISTNKNLRQKYLSYLKELVDSTRDSYKHWKLRDKALNMNWYILSSTTSLLVT